TIAVSTESKVFTEADGYRTEVPADWHYYHSKIRAEKLALDYARRDGLPIVVANPALLLGPGDDLGSSTGDIALFLKGQVMAIPPGGMCFIDARDAAAGLIAAMRSGRVGERYLLGGVNWKFSELMKQLGNLTGIRPPLLKSPLRISLWSAPLLRRLLPLVGRSFDMDDVTIKMSAYFWFFDSAKAKEELGVETRDPIETLRDTVEYIRQHAA
ncbi:MAG: NAD-dependent epimerase/dehydratase family protein, partial [bacterium]|nr:NAD-dependent epimerase/dehydratase family protein [bacterium]